MIIKSVKAAVLHKKRLIVMIAFIGALHMLKAQLPLNSKAYHDSLYTALSISKNDSMKARTAFRLSHYWAVQRDYKQAEKYLVLGRSCFKSNRFLLGMYYRTIITIYTYNDPAKSRKALYKTDSLLSVFKTPDAYTNLAGAWYSEAIIAQRESDEKKSLWIIINKVIPLAEKSGNSATLATFYSQVGILMMNRQLFEKAEEYFTKVIQMKNVLPAKKNTLVRVYIYSAENFTYAKAFKRAEEMLKEARKILDKNPGATDHADYYLAEGRYFDETKQYHKALLSYEQGKKYAVTIHDKDLENWLTMKKADIFFKTKQYPDAEKLLMNLLKTGYTYKLDNERRLYDKLAYVSNALGKYKDAYEWQKKCSVLSDSMYQAQLDKDIVAIEARFKNSEKEKTIMQLQASKKQEELKSKNQKLTSWILGIAGAALLIGLFFLVYSYKSAKKLSVQKEINHQQRLNEIEQQHHLKLVKEMLDAEERERQRIGRDLHDGLGGMLAGIKMNLTQQQKTDYHNLNTVISRLDESVVELRRISRNMVPESLLKIGLETSLRDLCELLENEETLITFQAIDIGKNIPDATQMHIYRIIQELLSNAMRHGQPSNIMLQCSQNQDMLYITVEDDGKGFDASVLDKSPGIGFTNIKNRIEYLKGNMEIVSAKGEGTAVNIELSIGSHQHEMEAI
ncbi:tetratricopeptide repeat-containing sensor histidine kinase [Chryseobacterium phocaeense]|uniref:tetratricopeptide repeat-containing sensor histidine kinase n=1 Tax=Chryseobacterium phocaeense TaxID=1816690 RepID=UPI0009BBC478|nr:sensor histidine kinase [Chryseobacterium phocaeense]